MPQATRSHFRTLVHSKVLWVLAAVFVVRTAVLAVGWSSLSEDPDAYVRLAETLASTGTYGFEGDFGTGETVRATAFRPPLYPALLSLFVFDRTVSKLAIAVFHILLGTASCWLVLSIGHCLRIRFASVAALAFAVDPLLLRASQLPMTETLVTFLALACWRLWLALPLWRNFDSSLATREAVQGNTAYYGFRGWRGVAIALSLGLAFGVAVLCRPASGPWAFLCACSIWVVCQSPTTRLWRSRIVTSGLISLGVVCVMVPWISRNWILLGKPIWATTHGGYTLLLANNSSIYQHFSQNGPSRNWDATPFHSAWSQRSTVAPNFLLTEKYWLDDHSFDATASMPELAENQLAYQAARATIARDPGMFMLSSIYRVGWFWAWWPNTGGRLSRVFIGTWYAVWTIAAVLGLLRRISGKRSPPFRISNWLPFVLLAFSLTGIHAVYWSNMRMRSPLVAGVYLLAVAGFSRNHAGTSLEKD